MKDILLFFNKKIFVPEKSFKYYLLNSDLKSFDELGVKTQKFAGIVIGSLIVQDILAILMMVLLSTVAVSQQFSGMELVQSVLKLIFFLNSSSASRSMSASMRSSKAPCSSLLKRKVAENFGSWLSSIA